MAAKAQWGGKLKWGDMDNEPVSQATSKKEDVVENPTVKIFSTTDPTSGITTHTEFTTNDKNQKVKIVRQVKTVTKKTKIPKSVHERRQWAKFGDCAGLPPGPEANVTYPTFEVINLQLKARKKGEDTQKDDVLAKLKEKDAMMSCRFCGESGHFTLKCPKRNDVEPKKSFTEEKRPETSSAPKDAKAGKYVVPAARKNAPRDRDDSAAIRITNISQETQEDDLRELCAPFGRIQRIYLAKERGSNISRGFAFVNFFMKEDAQKAVSVLNGHGYDNLILTVEFAKPRDEVVDEPEAKATNVDEREETYYHRQRE